LLRETTVLQNEMIIGDETNRMKRFLWLTLLALGLGTKRHWHILFVIILGAVLGLVFSGPQYSLLYDVFETIGQVFIRLIGMLVVPMVVSSLVVGVTSIGDGRSLGRFGGRVLGWFIIMMGTAALIGLGLGQILKPGENLGHVLLDPTSTLHTMAQQHSALQAEDIVATAPSWKELILGLIPKNPVQALAEAQMVPLVLFTLFFAAALSKVGEAGRTLINLFESIFATTMKMTDWVFILAVPGVFSLTFISVAKAGPQIFQILAPYAIVVTIGLLIQTFVVMPILLKVFANVNFIQLYKAISEAIMVSFGTASSSATLPVSIACCENRAGVSHRVASFVLPTGASINKTGTTLFEVIAVLFLAQAFGLELSFYTQMLIVAFSVLASIATPGVPSAGLITLAIVINSIGEGFTPLFGGIALLWPIDRILDMLRTAINVISSCTVAVLVSAQEGDLNYDVLNGTEAWDSMVGDERP
jgi:proton glutamate symport protein